MKQRGFTVIELLVVVAIIMILLVVVMTALTSSNTSVSTPINAPAATVPEGPSGYQVHTVPLEGGLSLHSTRVHNAVVKWLREHPGHKLIDMENTEDGYIVIITETK
jgi:prepilin-type N-terminal cleavage/methylation domain-containing protein